MTVTLHLETSGLQEDQTGSQNPDKNPGKIMPGNTEKMAKIITNSSHWDKNLPKGSGKT